MQVKILTATPDGKIINHIYDGDKGKRLQVKSK